MPHHVRAPARRPLRLLPPAGEGGRVRAGGVLPGGGGGGEAGVGGGRAREVMGQFRIFC